MSASLSSKLTEEVLRAHLLKEGYHLSEIRPHGQNGVDILAERNGQTIHIEVIAYKRKGSSRTKDFCEGVFRCLSRLDGGAEKCVLAMPSQFAVGLPQRGGKYSVAWKRMTEAFPEFSLWLVDCNDGRYRDCKLTEWTNIKAV